MSRVTAARSGSGWRGWGSGTIWRWIRSSWIAANPKHILVGAWVLGSTDGGTLHQQRWRRELGESTRRCEGNPFGRLTAAPSDPKMLVAGTLKGVYRSTDGGEHWQLISPEGSQELHEVESIAIDPANPQIIYAGTWHLPWKTTDGGAHWTNIKQGVIDDSDVFSIIVDPKDPNVVYASACSGIYKSQNGGEKFQKVQGIPSTARRTRVLMQDPQNLNIVFAGTTEGLYRTGDSGATWLRTTGPEVIVNDVYVDPAEHESGFAGDGSRRRAGEQRWGLLVSSVEQWIFGAADYFVCRGCCAAGEDLCGRGERQGVGRGVCQRQRRTELVAEERGLEWAGCVQPGAGFGWNGAGGYGAWDLSAAGRALEPGE